MLAPNCEPDSVVTKKSDGELQLRMRKKKIMACSVANQGKLLKFVDVQAINHLSLLVFMQLVSYVYCYCTT